MKRAALRVFTAVSLLLSTFLVGLGSADAKHTDVFVVSMKMDPSNPVVGSQTKLSIVLTNLGNTQKTVSLSFALDGKWIIDDVNLEMPAKKSAVASMSVLMPTEPGEHRLKVCPDREVYGDGGDQCETLDFVVMEEPALAVAITSPKDGAVLSGMVELQVAALGENAERVDLFIQSDKLDQLLDSKASPPFVFTVDTRDYPDGNYKLYAMAHFESGISRISSFKHYTIANSQGEESLVVRVKPGILLEERASIGQRVEIGSSITNGQPFKIAATLIVLVKDPEGYTEHISWYEERIRSEETTWISREWIPERSGKYSVEVFLWDTIVNPVPLSEVMKANLVVP